MQSLCCSLSPPLSLSLVLGSRLGYSLVVAKLFGRETMETMKQDQNVSRREGQEQQLFLWGNTCWPLQVGKFVVFLGEEYIHLMRARVRFA